MVKAYDTSTGKLTFDIGVKRTSGTVIGMMTRKDTRSVPAYQVYDDEFLASQFFTGEPGYGSLPTEKELAIIGADHRAGFGMDVYDANDPKRYLTTDGMDLRFRGMAIAGPIATAATLPTLTALLDSGLEAWTTSTNLTSWTETLNQGTVTQDDTSERSGTYCAVLVSGAGNIAYYAEINQSVSIDTSYRGKVIRASVWVKTTGATSARLTISDEDGSATSSYHTGGGAYENLTATRTIGASATYYNLALRVTNNGGNVTAYVDDFSSPALGVITCSADFNNLMYFSAGNCLLEMSAAGVITFVTSFISEITDLEVFGSNLFIALGLSNTYYYMSTAEVFTISTTTVKNFKYFKLVDAATPVLWGSDSVNTIRSSITGTADDWSGVTTIAASYNAITGMFTDAGSLYINKTDMPYYLNSTGAVKNDLAPELQTIARSADNGKNAFFWLHNFYLPWGTSLLENDSGVNTWRSPNDFSTQLADFVGQVYAVSGDDHYLFAIICGTAFIWVLAGRSEVIDDTTRWVWHPIAGITPTTCETCWVSSVYQKRLWVSSTSSSDSLYYIPLPLAYGNVLADANRSFKSGTGMDTPWLHGNFKSTVKAFIKLELVMGHTYDADIYFLARYKKLGDSSWTTIGNYTGSATSMIQSRYIPVDASGNNPKSTLFKLRFVAYTDDVQKTPVLLSYHLKAVLYPDQREIIAMKVYCANEIILRDGGTDSGSYQTIIDTLDEARVSTYPVTIYDIDGTARTGKFLPLPNGINTPRWKPIANEKDRTFEREYNLLFQLIPLS